MPDEQVSTSKKQRKKDKGKEKAPISVEPCAPAWAWTLLADSTTARCPPVFTKDSKHVFVASASSVKIYSLTTTKLVSTLHIPVTNKRDYMTRPTVRALVVSPQNPFQLLAASTDGFIRVWDFLDGVLLRTIECKKPVTHMVSHLSIKDHVFIATHVQSRQGVSKTAIYRVSIKLNQSQVDRFKHGKLGPEPLTGLAISPSGTSLVATSGKNAFVAKTADMHCDFIPYLSTVPISCLAFHPNEEIFATGDTDGIIRLWYCLEPRKLPNARGGFFAGRRKPKAPTTAMHWHAHAVTGLAFTPNGAYLLSGGEESVLVVWQLQTGHKEFVPRLGAPIEHITVAPPSRDGEQGYLVSLSDGSMSMVESNDLRVSRTFTQVKQTSRSDSKPFEVTDSTPLALHSSTSYIIIPSSHPSSLQIYSPASQEIVSELEVSPSNRVSRRDDAPLEQARVTHAVTSSSGEWLATVDYRDCGDDFGNEVVLKIWRWERSASATGTFVLNTRVDRPHGQDKITSASFGPADSQDITSSACILLTTGENGALRTWSVRSSRAGKNGEEDIYWGARSTFSYRDQIPSKGTWSPDGSLIAVAHGPTVTLWEPLSNMMVGVLAGAEVPSVVDLCFLGASGRHIAVYCNEGIVVWDIILSSVIWSHMMPLPDCIMIPHPKDDSFTLIQKRLAKTTKTPPSSTSDHSLILVFSIHSPEPLRTHSIPFGLRQAIWYPDVVSSKNDATFRLLGVTADHSAVIVGDEINLKPAEGSTARDIAPVGELNSPSLFQDIFGRSAFADVELVVRRDSGDITDAPAPTSTFRNIDMSILDGQAYLLPPINTLFDALMDGFTKTVPSVSSATTDSSTILVPEQKDLEMADGESGAQLVTRRRRAPRKIDHHEMDLFTELFRTVLSNTPTHGVTANLITHSKKMNGHNPHIANGKRPATPVTVSTPVTRKLNGAITYKTSTPSAQVNESSPVSVGKKRKKSST